MLANEGWLSLLDLRIVTFREVMLAIKSDDRLIWRFAQAQGMILLTANRNMEAPDSLEQTIREENTPSSLPVLTIGSLDRFGEPHYRERCYLRLLDIVLYLDDYLGAGRLFIP
jgi:hypothetical protein